MTDFALKTTKEILAAVDAGANYAHALETLAKRVLRERPRAQAIDGFNKLLHDADAPARPNGDVAAYKAWVAKAQADAKALVGEPKAPAKRKTTAKRKTGARKASPKAKAAAPASVNRADVAKAMGVSEDALAAMASFFSKLA